MPEPTPIAAPTGKNGASTQVSRDALLAELSSIPDDPKVAAKPVVVEPKPAEAVEPDPVEPVADDAPEEKVEAKPETVDADTQKRIDRVRKEEKRVKTEIADARAEWKREQDSREAKLAPRLEAADRIEKMKARGKTALMELAEEMGVTEDDHDALAKAHYALSKQGKADPRNRPAADQALEKRAHADEVKMLRDRLDARDKADAERESQRSAEQAANAYADRTVQVIGDESPLLRTFHAKSPDKARRALMETAYRLYKEEGDEPDPADVVSAWEKQRRGELEDLGIDPSAAIRPTAAAPKAPSKTLGAGGGATQPKKNTRDPKEVDAEIRRQLLEDKLE